MVILYGNEVLSTESVKLAGARNCTPKSRILLVKPRLSQDELVSSFANFKLLLDFVVEHRSKQEGTSGGVIVSKVD